MNNQLYWVIIPAYNESAYLERVLKKVKKIWPSFIVIDDGSSDNTSKMAQKLSPHVLTHTVNLGKGAALKTGCEYAFKHLNAKGVVFFDADDQHDAKCIPLMVEKLKDFPVVLGVRSFNNQMPFVRILFNRVSSIITLVFFGKYIPDIPSGFKAISIAAYKKVKWQSCDYLVEMEIASNVARYKIPFTEVPIPTIYHDLDRGMTVLDILHMLYQMLLWKINR